MFPETVTQSLNEAVVSQAASLEPEERQALLLQYVKKAGVLWSLAGTEGYVMLESQHSTENFSALLPVWPHKDLVGLWQRSDMPDAQPAEIGLDDFMQTWLPGLAKNHIGLVIFPVGEGQSGMVLSAEELQQSLLEE